MIPAEIKTAELEQIARRVRATCVQMSHMAKEGHLSSALSCIDILVALYFGWLNVDPSDPKLDSRDRFLFSKGHAASAMYAVLSARGFFSTDLLREYCKPDSPLPNHTCKGQLSCLEISAGSLGHGLGIGTGIATSLRLKGQADNRVAVLMSDGECNEGSVWEAAGFAAGNKLSNLLAIVDNNNSQAVGRTDKLLGPSTFGGKFEAFGWAVRTIDGHNMQQLLTALHDFPFAPDKPSAIVCKTKGGSGVSFMTDQIAWHYKVPTKDELTKAISELGESPLFSLDGVTV